MSAMTDLFDSCCMARRIMRGALESPIVELSHRRMTMDQ
jgi:hypothetical protein